MTVHDSLRFSGNVPTCVACSRAGASLGVCPADERPIHLHADAGYCPQQKFAVNLPRPEGWADIPAAVTGLPFRRDTPVETILAALDGPAIEGPAEWTRWENVREAYRQALRAYADSVPDYPEDRYRGRGIVIPGGGPYADCAYVTIRVLRHVGCTLPIELWHLPGEMLEDWQVEALHGHGVTVVDAGEVRKHYPARRLGGWELKSYAIQHSGFEHVLLLDADCYPVRDPSFLFDSPQYKERGAIFWSDQPKYDLKPELCAVLGIEHRDEPDVESGQIVIDKRRCWRELCATVWMNGHSDYYYKLFHGDKCTLHVVWRFLGTEYATPPQRWSYAKPAMLQKDFAGHTLFVHRSEGKLVLNDAGGNTFGQHTTGQYSADNRHNPAIPLEDVAWSFLDDLRTIRDKHHNHGHIFGRVYANREWGNGSGPGSAPEATGQYRELLERILHSGRINRVVDLGCGDWQFSKLVNWNGIEYLGVDCVRGLIEANQQNYSRENIRFQHADLMEFDPPPCDLILVKDVLQHWPTDDVKRFLSRMSGREMLITNTVQQPRQKPVNCDIRAGDFRPLDLTAPPYNFGRAKLLLDYTVGKDDQKQTLLIPGPVDLVRAATGIGRALLGSAESTVAERRQEICDGNECGHAVRKLGIFQQCGVCKCSTTVKVRDPKQSCPVGKWPKVGTRIAFVQLGRAGDILILIPALKFLAEMGVVAKLITRPEYALIAQGLPGIEVVPTDAGLADWPKAEAMGRKIADEVRVTQCGYNPRKRMQPNFAMEGFYRTGAPVSLFHSLPLILENQDRNTEAKIAAEHIDGRPLVLFNATGHSTPYPDGAKLLDDLRQVFPDAQILDLGGIQAPRLQDLLGLYERAKVLVSTDTATLHLGYVTRIPTVALVSDFPGGGSPTRPHWIERIGYAESSRTLGRLRIQASIRKCVEVSR